MIFPTGRQMLITFALAFELIAQTKPPLRTAIRPAPTKPKPIQAAVYNGYTLDPPFFKDAECARDYLAAQSADATDSASRLAGLVDRGCVEFLDGFYAALGTDSQIIATPSAPARRAIKAIVVLDIHHTATLTGKPESSISQAPDRVFKNGWILEDCLHRITVDKADKLIADLRKERERQRVKVKQPQ